MNTCTHKRRRGLKFENLERRLLMAKGPGPDTWPEGVPADIDLNDGVLEIRGTIYDDLIEVQEVTRVAWTKTGPHLVPKIRATVRDTAGTLLVRGYFDPDSVDKVDIYASRGDDVVYNNTAIESEIDGGYGADVLHGGSAADVILGGPDNDKLYGENGDDVLQGEGGNDKLYGRDGSFTSYSGPDDDVLQGGDGQDRIYGEGGNDRLFGGDGYDRMFGGGGSDGLYGGADGAYDLIIGGAGSDRFLTPAAEKSRDFTDKGSDDVEIYFEDGDEVTKEEVTVIGGTVLVGTFVVTTKTWPGAGWTEPDVILVDDGLALLHQESASLLEYYADSSASPSPLTFVRQGPRTITTVTYSDPPVVLIETTPGANGWNSGGGRITMTEDGMDNKHDRVVQTVIHEIGHNFDDENDDWGGFMAISGWAPTASVGSMVYGLDESDFQKSGDGNWWHVTEDTLSGATFARDYGMKNPYEDFATSFTAYFMFEAGLEYGGSNEITSLSEIDAKKRFLDDFFATL